MTKNILTPEQETIIISRYLATESCTKISKDYGVHSGTIRNVLIRNEIPLRSPGPIGFTMNHKCFDVLTEESLYWMGFITADGSITRQKGSTNRLAIGLQQSDRGHIEKFLKFAEASVYSINDYDHGPEKKHKASSVAIRSGAITRRLEELGVKGTIPHEDLTNSRHYWRGVVDGDGYITKTAEQGKMDLAGQIYVIEPFQKFLADHLGIYANISYDGVSTYRLFASGSIGYKVLSYLYRDNVVSLDRKQNRADEIIRHYQEKDGEPPIK